MAELVTFDIPVPEHPDKIRAFHDGKRWITGIVPGSVVIDDYTLTCLVRWGHTDERRRITLALDLVGGYQVAE